MNKAIDRYLYQNEKLVDIFEDYKNEFTSLDTFKLKVNQSIEQKFAKRYKKKFPDWLDKNDGIWEPATYAELSPSEKDIYNARANKDFLP